ncbi:MAG: hypothetical protein CVU71_10140 [Deltaproteobacteria bacterium HGW-Deltaproteobacteria-6]|nr:MAG: hypothetical protein CVU71_10140 [Deltaproteobacteria bacterium HGW-Deltaproteobacteria-6]
MAVLLTGANVSYAGPDDSESKTAVKLSLTERMDAHLSMLHTKLQITKAQEDQWQKFARVMLENNKTMQDLQEKRQKEVRLMTALDDLKSYSEIADAHAGGLKKFIPAFEALYNSMTDEQKRNADSLFLNQREIMSGKRASN